MWDSVLPAASAFGFARVSRASSAVPVLCGSNLSVADEITKNEYVDSSSNLFKRARSSSRGVLLSVKLMLIRNDLVSKSGLVTYAPPIVICVLRCMDWVVN